MDEQRSFRDALDVAGGIAILYTFGFLILAGMLYFYSIPATNKDALLYLFGILSGIELSIIAFYFGGSKNVETAQRATEQRQAKTESVLQDIAKAAPMPAATPAPVVETPPAANGSTIATPPDQKGNP